MSLSNLAGSFDTNYVTPGVETCLAVVIPEPLQVIPNDDNPHNLTIGQVLTGNPGLFALKSDTKDAIIVKKDGSYRVDASITLASSQARLQILLKKVEAGVTSTLAQWNWIGNYGVGGTVAPEYQTMHMSQISEVVDVTNTYFFWELTKTTSADTTPVATDTYATHWNITRLGDIVSGF